jgi:hypothetical protein
LQKHIQILVREFKTAKPKTGKRKERQDRKKKRRSVQPNRGLAWIPFRYPTDKQDPAGGNSSSSSIRRKQLAVERQWVTDAKIRATASDAL